MRRISLFALLLVSQVLASSPTPNLRLADPSDFSPARVSAFWSSPWPAVLLVFLATFFSAMSVAYLSIDELVLELKTKTGTDEEKRDV